MKYKVIVNKNGEFWYKKGTNIRHRLDGPAVIRFNGTKEWYKDGQRHRLDGPAVIRFNGTKEWWVKGKCHREDGPAIIYSDGDKEWWIEGKRLTEEEFNNRNKKDSFTRKELKNMSLDQIHEILSEE